MSLIVETGAGVQDAESYATVAFIDTYWAARTHNALSAVWAAVTPTGKKEGAAREATAFIDTTWGVYYLGVRRGFVQGLLYPRTGAKDEAGYPLPDMPSCLQTAAAELAARAVTTTLAADIDAARRVKVKTIGPLTTEFFDAGTSAPGITYGVVGRMLAPILNGSQPGAPASGWHWA